MSRRIIVLCALVSVWSGMICAQNATWSPQAPTGNTTPKSECGFAYDSILSLHVLFGGLSSTGTRSNETYFYDGVGTWSLLPLTSQPSARTCSMVYDSARGVSVIYGGDDGAFPSASDTWEFNGSAWNQVITPSNPGPRIETAMSFDPVQAETVLFSGAGLITIYAADTWTYDGLNWTQVFTVVQPGGRRGHRMVYDSARGVHVLFGGESHLLFKYNDTWEFNAAGGTWTQVVTANAPSPRHLHAMAYDATRGVTVVYGGSDMNGNPLGDTWEYDGTNWTQVTGMTAPTARRGARFSSDALNGAAVLYGGEPLTGSSNDTWLYASIPPTFPGSGGDCAINVTTNGLPASTTTGVHPLVASDQFGLRLNSPQGTLNNQPFALVLTPYTQGSPPAGLALLGGAGAANVWVDPANAVILLDSLSPPTSFFVPLLVSGGLTLGPYNVPAGIAGTAANLQLFVSDPGVNPVNLSTSDAAALEFN